MKFTRTSDVWAFPSGRAVDTGSIPSDRIRSCGAVHGGRGGVGARLASGTGQAGHSARLGILP